LGERACAEWIVTLTHSGPLHIDDDTTIDPTGLRVTLHGVTVAEFAGDKIASFRQYWDEVELLEQLALLPGE
jgi:ketosteroid isomerase-like protein